MLDKEKKFEIFETKDYEKFYLLEFNRKINPNHVESMKNLLKIENKLHLHPFIVSEDFGIIEGQHRFLACKDLGLSFYYVIDENFHPSSISTLNNAGKNWKILDYVHHWARLNKEFYIELEKLMEQGYSLPEITSFCFFDDGKAATKIKKGIANFDISIDHLQKCKELLNFFQKTVFERLRMDKKIFNSMRFLRCFSWLIRQKNYDFEKFCKNLHEKISLVYIPGTSFAIKLMLVKIHNFNNKKRIEFIEEDSI